MIYSKEINMIPLADWPPIPSTSTAFSSTEDNKDNHDNTEGVQPRISATKVET